MRDFRVVACAATTMLMSDGLVAAMTLVVGACSGVSEGPSSWSSPAVKSERQCSWTYGDDALWRAVRL
jgi:hypothetical protein